MSQPSLFPLPEPRYYDTPGTALRWHNLAEWLAGYHNLDERRGDNSDKAMLRHLALLPRPYIEAETDLELLHAVHTVIRQRKPPRGGRKHHPTTRLEIWLNHHLARLAAEDHLARLVAAASTPGDAS